MMGDVVLVPRRRIVVTNDPGEWGPQDVVATYRDSVAQSALKLAHHGFRKCPPRIHDLCLLVAGVSHADKAVARWRHIWRRDLTVALPVYEPDFWQQKNVLKSLSAVLSALTGDSWAFEFYQRKDAPPTIPQTALPIKREDLRVLPYSHGLDSFALRGLEMEGNSRRSLVLMTSGGRPPGWTEFQSKYGADRVEHLTLPFHTKLDSKQGRETSNRSRAFVFGVAASVTTYFCQSSTILCGEAGQGSLGPWLDPVGIENPDIRTHPLFSRQLESFTKLVLDHEVIFEHPRIWSTKGQTLRELVQLRLHDGWETTLSCADRRGLTVLDGKRVNCGACAACLLRRTSLHAAGLDHNSQPYLWAELSASTLQQAAHPLARKPEPNDELQVWAGVAAMERFGQRASEDVAATKPVRLFELSQSCRLAATEASKKLTKLTADHQAEWDGFAETLGVGSLVNSYRVRLQARRS